MPNNSHSLIDRLQLTGCWAVGLYAFAIFFALGAAVSLLNGDIMRTLGAVTIGMLSLGGGIWLAQRNASASRKKR